MVAYGNERNGPRPEQDLTDLQVPADNKSRWGEDRITGAVQFASKNNRKRGQLQSLYSDECALDIQKCKVVVSWNRRPEDEKNKRSDSNFYGGWPAQHSTVGYYRYFYRATNKLVLGSFFLLLFVLVSSSTWCGRDVVIASYSNVIQLLLYSCQLRVADCRSDEINYNPRNYMDGPLDLARQSGKRERTNERGRLRRFASSGS